MIKQSLGLIETVGLSAAIVAADTAVKSANVTLIGYELTKGGGMVVVKILGEVAAVNAAIDAARISAAKVSQVYATKVIARVAEGLDILLDSQNHLTQENTSVPDEATKDSAELEVINIDEEVKINPQSIEIKVLPENNELENDSGCIFTPTEDFQISKDEEDNKKVDKKASNKNSKNKDKLSNKKKK